MLKRRCNVKRCILVGILLLLCCVVYFKLRTKKAVDDIFVAVVEEHHEVLPYWFDGVKDGFLQKSGMTVIHIDGHSDDAPPEFNPQMPFFSWPADNTHMDAILQKNDIHVQISAMSGFLDRFIWIKPSWLDDEDPYSKETVELGFFKKVISGTRQPTFCECRTDMQTEESKCFYINYTLVGTETDADIQIPRTRCKLKALYEFETITEDTAIERLHIPNRRSKNKKHDVMSDHRKKYSRDTWMTQANSNKLWISGQDPVIWDIDLDYFGCEMPGQVLLDAGFTSRVIQLINKKLQFLFCPRRIEHELHSDLILRQLLKVLIRLCDFDFDNEYKRCTTKLSHIESIIDSKLLVYYKNFPSMFCAQNDLALRKSWKNILFIVHHLTLKQLRSLFTVGFCFSSSPKTFEAKEYISVMICHGLNEPNTTIVQKYTPTIEDIDLRMEKLERILLLLPSPDLVTICRSARDGYVPRAFRQHIEDGVITAIRKAKSMQHFKVIYDGDLLGGKEGWDLREDLLSGMQ